MSRSADCCRSALVFVSAFLSVNMLGHAQSFEPLSEMVERAIKSSPTTIEDHRGLGISLADGSLVATASHLALKCTDFLIEYRDGHSSTARLLGVNTEIDTAILRVSSAKLGVVDIGTDHPTVGVKIQWPKSVFERSAETETQSAHIVRSMLAGPTLVWLADQPSQIGESGGMVLDRNGSLVGMIIGVLGSGETGQAIFVEAREVLAFSRQFDARRYDRWVWQEFFGSRTSRYGVNLEETSVDVICK